MILQHFIVEGKYLGQVARASVQFDFNSRQYPLSKFFYCVECGETFAKCPVEIGPKTANWTAVPACCIKCQPTWGQHVAGSIWHHEAEFTASFPPEVLAREFHLHLRKFT